MASLPEKFCAQEQTSHSFFVSQTNAPSVSHAFVALFAYKYSFYQVLIFKNKSKPFIPLEIINKT